MEGAAPPNHPREAEREAYADAAAPGEKDVLSNDARAILSIVRASARHRQELNCFSTGFVLE
jgi:hypothetical protein